MPVTVQCPRCTKNLNVPDASLGQLGRCPSCDHVFLLADDSIEPTPIAPTQFMAVPSTIGPVPPPNDFGGDDPNEFAISQSGGRAVHTQPRTFNLLFNWLLIVTLAQFLAGAAIFVVALDATPRPSVQAFGPSGQVISGGYLDVGGKTIYFRDLSDAEAAALLAAACLLILATIAQTVLFFVLLYKCWALIQDGYPQTTPGKAVGFWFIPLFNLYWIFVAVRGLAEDLNRFASRRNLPIRKASVGLATFYCVVKLCSMFPLRFGPMSSFIGYLAIPALLLELIVMYQIKNAAADVAAARTA